ncbi:annexin A13-like [Oryza brachyantha]|uniref:annexin A13-like n=1 Tax=Oryza brachyantha TaxID=4533 RepID=UPI001ADB14F1|nr:annexin A13-like [Oryza brachyantha]
MMASSRDFAKRYEADCRHLNQFFSGNASPSNARPVLEIFTTRSSQEMKQICRAYSSMYHQDLLLLLSQQKTNFARVACLRASEPCVRDADIARDALFGRRLDGDVLVEVVCTRPSAEVASIRQAYQARYSASLERDVSSRTSGSLNEVLLAFLGSSGYHGGRVDATMAMCDAKTLYEAVESGRGVDRRSILQLLRHRSGDQLRAVLASYRRLYGQELARALKRKADGVGHRSGESFPGVFRAALRCAQRPERHFARAVRVALERGGGGGAAREALVRAVVTRAGVDVRRVNQAFAAKTGWTLESVVRNEFAAGNADDGLTGDLLVELLKLA